MFTLYLKSALRPNPLDVATTLGLAPTAVTVISRGSYHQIHLTGLDALTSEQRAALLPAAAPAELTPEEFAEQVQ